MCAENIAGLKVKPINPDNIPGCIYSHPQIASIGLSEEKALTRGLKIKVGRFPFMANGKALAMGDAQGLVKTIFDATTGELLGAHMIGAEVTELIQIFALCKTAELTEGEIIHTIFAHPTLSEMLHESTLSAFGRAIHQ
jgi:dihydrolipoamide dehydrogenase